MRTKHKGVIHIGRVTGSKDYVTIELEDGTSHTHVVGIELSLTEFGDAISGRGFTPCVFEVNDSLVGWTPEYKEEVVELKCESYKEEDRRKAAAKALKPFEKDGWVGRVDDILNHHRRVGPGSCYRVHFQRYIRPKE